MKTKTVKVIEVPDHDRYIFVTYIDHSFVGISFHQGLEHVQASYFKPNKILTEIYKELIPHNEGSIEFMNECVERYCEAMVYFDMKAEFKNQ